MRFGLSDQELQTIIGTLKKFPEIEEAVVFGSRAMGRERKGSDVDVALKGNGVEAVVFAVSHELNEESPLPYYFDIVDYQSITTAELKEHIDRVGKSLYTKKRN